MNDFSELAALEADLRAAGPKVSRNVVKALHVTAGHVKADWRQAADRTGLHAYAADIDYDLEIRPGEISAEVGPTPDGDAGGLGIVEDAPGGVRSRPQHAGRSALRANEDDFERGVLIAAIESWESR